MTKKHFDALAAYLYAVSPPDVPHSPYWQRRNQWTRDCQAIADAYAQFAPKFDRVRFLRACGASL